MGYSPSSAMVSNAKRALALINAGHAGAGMRPETIAWVRKVARGEALTPAKILKARAWLRRHGPSVAEGRRRVVDPTSPAAVAWLAWFADPAISWRADPSVSSDPAVRWIEQKAAEAEDDRAVRTAKRAKR